MAKKGLVGGIIASILLSVMITGGLSFFVLPIIYPNMIQTPSFEDEGIVLQSVYAEFNTSAIIAYDNITFQKIPDTEASITIQENSTISVTFNAIFMLILNSSYSGSCVYNISLVVNGYGNQTYTIAYLKDGIGQRVIPINLYVTFITSPLSAGPYLVEVYLKSYIGINNDHSLALNKVMGQYFENPRSLLLLELA
ncbi:MAG: hypothetical protein ACW972_01555 [Promethearchaeota archaeon]|jgi:hypothetical protein